MRRRMVSVLDDAGAADLSPLLHTLVSRCLDQLRVLDGWIADATEQLRLAFHACERCRRLADVPGIGPVVATAAVGMIGNARAFKNGRQLAAWMGLTPRQHSSGGRIRLLGITKHGDPYLRTLFVQGARAVLRTIATRHDALGRWVRALLLRRHKHVVAIALANKMARIIWAVMATGGTYQPAGSPTVFSHGATDLTIAKPLR